MVRRRVRRVGSSECGGGVLFHIVRGRVPAGWLYHYFITKKGKVPQSGEKQEGRGAIKARKTNICPDLLASMGMRY